MIGQAESDASSTCYEDQSGARLLFLQVQRD